MQLEISCIKPVKWYPIQKERFGNLDMFSFYDVRASLSCDA